MYAYAALKIANPNLKRHARRLSEKIEDPPEDTGARDDAPSQPAGEQKKESGEERRQKPKRRAGNRKRRNRSWVNSW